MSDDRKNLPSASKLPLIADCAGAWNLIRKAPPEKPSVFAESGNRVHDALKIRSFAELNPEETEVATQCDRLETRWHEQIGFTDELVYSERRIWLRDPKTGALLMSCRFDKAFLQGAIAALVDYKTGRVPVTAPARKLADQKRSCHV
jgi:hypothetical protein